MQLTALVKGCKVLHVGQAAKHTDREPMNTMTREISNYDDVIDSRDVIARIEELAEAVNESGMGAINDDEIAELAALRELDEEGRNIADWEHGAGLIRDSYFVTYAQELADDIGAINSEIGWPYSCIDWKKAAWKLRMDYTSVEFDGVTYWVR